MSGFSADWLALREPVDHAARRLPGAFALAQAFAQSVRSRAIGSPKLVDLAGGTGSNVRFLAPVIGGTQGWEIWEWDKDLLEPTFDRFRDWATSNGWSTSHAGESLVVTGADLSLTIRSQQRDLREPLDFRGFDGVCNAALLDLASEAWCDRVLDALGQAGWPPFFASLVADGGWDWSPPVADDQAALDAFAEDMKTDKGFGPALGHDAATTWRRLAEARNLEVREADSPWHLGPDQAEVQLALLGFAETVLRRRPTPGGSLGGWVRSRRDAANRSNLRLGHREVLTLAPN